MNAIRRAFDSDVFLGIVRYRVAIILVATIAISASLVPGATPASMSTSGRMK